MSSIRNDDYLERVKAEIRAEAEVARARPPLARRDVPAPALAPAARHNDGIERTRLDYTIGELTGTHYSTFVDQAFRALLKRPPDDAGSAMQVRLLAGGASKAEVLGNLRWSPEGRRIGTRVRGLLPRYAQAKLARVPVIGYFFDWSLALAGLPMLLRHQRAADTWIASRFDAATDAATNARRQHDSRLDHLDTLVGELGAERERRNADFDAQREHGRRLNELAARIGALGVEHDRRATALSDNLQRMVRRLDELEHRSEVLRHRGDAMQSQIDALHERSEALEGRASSMEGRTSKVEERLAPVESRSFALESRNETNASEMIALRHYVHAANHWIVSMQTSLAALEETTSAEREQADALVAALNGTEDSASRTKRHADWAAKLVHGLPARAHVLDLGSGDGAWLETLGAAGVSASGVESNHALAARARNVQIAYGDPLAALARSADADLDAITLAAAALAGDGNRVAHALTHIRRALKPTGRVLLRIEDEPHHLGNLLGARPTETDAHHWAALLSAAGFAHTQVLTAKGAAAVLAQRAVS